MSYITWIGKGEQTTRKALIDAALAKRGDRTKIIKKANAVIDGAIESGFLAEDDDGGITLKGSDVGSWAFEAFTVDKDD